MSYRWDVEEAEAPRRLLQTLAAAIVFGGILAVGWRWWAGQRLIREIKADVTAAFALEEKAVADEDWGLFIQRQSRSRARQLRAARGVFGDGLVHPPIGGLQVESAEPKLKAIEVDTDVPVGDPIRRVTITLEHRVRDDFGGGSLRSSGPTCSPPRATGFIPFRPRAMTS